MTHFALADLLTKQQEAKQSYLEFLRVPSLSSGLYVLPAGATDPQRPHGEDEVYYVINGRGSFQAGNESCSVEAGTILFVPAQQEHRFHSITEELTLLVFFAPAEQDTGS